jgi:hypothetical protein
MKELQNFLFSQSSLQDFSDCPRRFQLRYLEHVSWPAVESEPILEKERLMALGSNFHRLVHQLLSGVPAEQIQDSIDDDQLLHWWKNMRSFLALLEGATLIPESSFSIPLQGNRLTAKIDLLAHRESENIIIVDWKTSRKKAPRAILQSRLQTRVYPFVLAEVGHVQGNKSSINPDQIEMLYWFPAEPESPEKFHYSSSQFSDDQQVLLDLVDRIITMSANRDRAGFPLTADERQCQFCIYRSLCGRGVNAGSFEQKFDSLYLSQDTIPLDEYDQIAEIEY